MKKIQLNLSRFFLKIAFLLVLRSKIWNQSVLKKMKDKQIETLVAGVVQTLYAEQWNPMTSGGAVHS